MEGNYPIPDPEWDYFGTWSHLQESKTRIEALLAELAEIEEATDQSDYLVSEALTKILHHLRSAVDFLPPSLR